jgi:hypothetical protein
MSSNAVWQDAFKEVVHRYAAGEWTPDGPELLVSVDLKPYSFESRAMRLLMRREKTRRARE